MFQVKSVKQEAWSDSQTEDQDQEIRKKLVVCWTMREQHSLPNCWVRGEISACGKVEVGILDKMQKIVTCKQLAQSMEVPRQPVT